MDKSDEFLLRALHWMGVGLLMMAGAVLVAGLGLFVRLALQ